MSVLAEGLGARDHNITIFSPYFVKNPPKGVQYIVIDIKRNAYEEYAENEVSRNHRRCAFMDLVQMALLSRRMCFGE